MRKSFCFLHSRILKFKVGLAFRCVIHSREYRIFLQTTKPNRINFYSGFKFPQVWYYIRLKSGAKHKNRVAQSGKKIWNSRVAYLHLEILFWHWNGNMSQLFWYSNQWLSILHRNFSFILIKLLQNRWSPIFFLHLENHFSTSIQISFKSMR